MTTTPEDLERLAYIGGNTDLANALAKIAELSAEVEELEEKIEELYNEIKATETKLDDAYKQFFQNCFTALDKHYPCPSVTSDYDKSVIFDAIRFGEEARALLVMLAESDHNLADQAKALLAHFK